MSSTMKFRFEGNDKVVNPTGQQIIHGDLNVHYSMNEQEEDRKNFLEALSFDGIDNRDIQLGKEGTSPGSLEWIWETDFPRWLSNSDEVYSIVGKPGSGKSTLMKYLADHQKTRNYLNSSGQIWHTVKFFFDFRAGSNAANSIDGLLRSCLLQILRKLPSSKTASIPPDIRGGEVVDIERLMFHLRESILTAQLRICTFIDGLDEFMGDETLLIRKLVQLKEQTGVKMCLASRPGLPISVLANDPNVLMQDHNRPSIQACVEEFSRSQNLSSSLAMQEVRDLIVKKSQGVILWAKLVCKSIPHWWNSGESLEILKSRLNDIPDEMGALYERIGQELWSRHPVDMPLLFHLVRTRGRAVALSKLYRIFREILAECDLGLSSFANMGLNIFEEHIINSSRGFLEIMNPLSHLSNIKCVILCHETLRSYLEQHGPQGQTLQRVSERFEGNDIWFKVYIATLENDAMLRENIEATDNSDAIVLAKKYDLRNVPAWKSDQVAVDAVFDIPELAAMYESRGEGYHRRLDPCMRTAFPTYHTWSCEICTGTAGRRQILWPLHKQVIGQRYDLWVATAHGLATYLRTQLLTVSIDIKNALLDGLIEITTLGEGFQRSMEALLDSGATIRTRNVCSIFIHRHSLKVSNVDKDYTDTTGESAFIHLANRTTLSGRHHPSCPLTDTINSTGLSLLRHWLYFGDPGHHEIALLSNEGIDINGNCSDEGPAIHAVLDCSLSGTLGAVSYMYSNMYTGGLRNLFGLLRTNDPPTLRLMRFADLICAGADTNVKGAGKYKSMSTLQKAYSVRRSMILHPRKFSKDSQARRGQPNWSVLESWEHWKDDLKSLNTIIHILKDPELVSQLRSRSYH